MCTVRPIKHQLHHNAASQPSVRSPHTWSLEVRVCYGPKTRWNASVEQNRLRRKAKMWASDVSTHSTTNLNSSITGSLSPSSYFIGHFNVSHHILSRFSPCTSTFSAENIPIKHSPKNVHDLSFAWEFADYFDVHNKGASVTHTTTINKITLWNELWGQHTSLKSSASMSTSQPLPLTQRPLLPPIQRFHLHQCPPQTPGTPDASTAPSPPSPPLNPISPSCCMLWAWRWGFAMGKKKDRNKRKCISWAKWKEIKAVNLTSICPGPWT